LPLFLRGGHAAVTASGLARHVEITLMRCGAGDNVTHLQSPISHPPSLLGLVSFTWHPEARAPDRVRTSSASAPNSAGRALVATRRATASGCLLHRDLAPPCWDVLGGQLLSHSGPTRKNCPHFSHATGLPLALCNPPIIAPRVRIWESGHLQITAPSTSLQRATTRAMAAAAPPPPPAAAAAAAAVTTPIGPGPCAPPSSRPGCLWASYPLLPGDY
jgi:hypothetical protein